MTVYYINLLLILGLAYPLCIYKPNKIKKAAYLVVVFGYMWFLATFRYGIGYDYFSYIRIFEEVRETTSLAELFTLNYEYGFLLLTKLITMITADYTVMYGIYSFLILAPVAWFVFVYCKDAWFSVWLYVTLAFFYTNMSFIRQSLATAIILLGYKFLREKKHIPFLLTVIAAAMFHKTALLMIPVYIAIQIKFNWKVGVFYAVAVILTFLLSEFILDIITNYVYTYYKDTVYTSDGLQMIFLLVPFTLFAACIALRSVWLKRDPDAPILFYMVMFSAIIWLFIVKHFVIERFSMYMYIFTLVAIPSAISCLKASPEDYAKLAELKEEQKKGKGGKTKEAQAKVRELTQKISDHQKYYWSAVVAIVLLTGLYNEFGGNVNNFHNVFPYQSVLEWLNF